MTLTGIKRFCEASCDFADRLGLKLTEVIQGWWPREVRSEIPVVVRLVF
jgi:hypothetical protein